MRIAWCVVLAACGFHGRDVDSDATPVTDGLIVQPDGAPIPTGFCPPLTAQPFTITVAGTAALKAAVMTVQPNAVIGLADGTYDLTAGITIDAPGLTLRSMSGDPTKVILQGGAATAITITAPSVTIADLTIANAAAIAIFVEGDVGNSDGTQIYDVTFADAGGPAVRIAPLGGSITGPFADSGTIACSRFHDTPAGNHCINGTLGIDGQAARGWIVRDNDFTGVACATQYERAILFRLGSRDTAILRNHLTGSNMNIALGIGPGPSRTYTDAAPASCTGNVPDHRDGVICGNVIDGLTAPPQGSSDFDTGIGLWGACDTWVSHNTVVSPAGGETYHDIEYRFAGTFVHLVNNLLEQLPASRDGGVSDPTFTSSNVVYAGLGDFISAPTGDLHLKTSAQEMPGIALPTTAMCSTDADGHVRNAASPTVGAYER